MRESLWRRLIRAFRLRGPSADDRNAATFNALLWALAIWWALWCAILIPLYHDNVAVRVPLAIFQEVCPVFALILLHFGSLRKASLVYLGGVWLFAMTATTLSGGVRGTNLWNLVTLPILATWLLGYRAALWTVVACSGGALFFAVSAVLGLHFPVLFQSTPIAIWVILLQVTLVGAVPVAHILRALRDTIEDSRSKHHELQLFKDHLEQLVDERTKELVEARDEALAANKAKSAFLANMSHELRTPLHAILGFSSLIRDDASLPEQHRKDLEIVETSGQRLLALIDDVLNIARIETGNAVVESRPVDLHSLVEETVTMLRGRAWTKDLALIVDITPEAPRYVRSDPGKLRQILTNLVGNSIKYTNEGSIRVKLDLGAGNPAQSQLLVIEVQDTGIGIAPENQARIFEPFVQLGTTNERKGTGLGLSICRRFAKLLGGSIQVESVPRQGSRFRVELPLAPTAVFDVIEEAAGDQQVIGLAPGQPEFRVLIVEDQIESRRLLSRFLEYVGFQVSAVENATEAIHTFQSWHPHLIWMDMRLPRTSGVETVPHIRQLEGGREVKIVAVTASVFNADRSQVLASGFDDFLRKPYRLGEVFDCMSRHLGVRYVYGAKPPISTTGPDVTLRPEEFASLSPALLGELENAVIALDANRMEKLVSLISSQNQALGRKLAHLVDTFAFTPILHALETSKHVVSKADV
jgi:signal transduction histidine kinase/CheY-like chemotaxis protein